MIYRANTIYGTELHEGNAVNNLWPQKVDHALISHRSRAKGGPCAHFSSQQSNRWTMHSFLIAAEQ